MPQTFSQRLTLATAPHFNLAPSDILRGIEKESLRIDPNGRLAQTPHPACLGSSLTNPFITTDYAESLLEFITPVHRDIDELLGCLDDIHRFVYPCLQHERLWTASMPCVLRGNENIPVARYGSSNIGRMKTIYRLGLGHRYGRAMQTIAGIHYNFSLSDAFWQHYQQALGEHGELQSFKNTHYLGMIRNFRRHAWLLIYLFGASPALCKSFLGPQDHNLDSWQEHTLYQPQATALRMGSLGYQSSAQEDLVISYNSLDSYVSTLRELLHTSHRAYEDIGTHNASGQWQQLSTSLLQIENEFYSSIRPKQPVESGEAPLKALVDRGIEYVEVRALDVNPYLPLGIGAEEIRFLDTFLLFCLFQPSPPLEVSEYQQSQQNLAQVVTSGRSPSLQLSQSGRSVAMRDLATSLCQDIASVARALRDDGAYLAAVQAQQTKISDSDKTPSGRILHDMQSRGMAWFDFAMERSRQHADYFLERPLNVDRAAQFAHAAQASLARQASIEAQPEVPFQDFLRAYYQQYK